jgi:hypothetical protein
MTPEEEPVSASEIAAWAWCPESWRLDAPGEEPGTIAVSRREEAKHRGTAGAGRSSRAAVNLGVWLRLAAVLLAVLFHGLGMLP